MPPENLPSHAKEIFTAAEANARKTTCKGRDNVDECAAKIAWSAVKNKYKKVGEKWVPKADVEFSLFINKASFDKATQEMRWSAVASDTEEDSFKDNMTEELYTSFLSRIESGEKVPEQYRSEYWEGGMPYLSLAHYPDLNGKAVPGPVDSVYPDGNRLKSKGRFYNTTLGRACFNSVCDDLYSQQRSDAQDKVRISIGFLDYKHKHKSNGFEFERKSVDDICPECVKETIEKYMNGTEPQGKEFLDGHLIHLALTRVPVNPRTDISVERSMTTRLEDALSIAKGAEDEVKEIADELAGVTGKSAALITKSEDELLGDKLSALRSAWASEYQKSGPNAVYTYVLDASDNYVIASHDDKYYKVDYAEAEGKVKFAQKSDWKEVRRKTTWVNVLKSLMLEDGFIYLDDFEELSEAEIDRAVTKKEAWGNESASSYLIVEDPKKPTTWHLPVKKHGKIDHGLMGAAKAALTAAGGHRGKQYGGPGKQKAISKLKALYKKEGLEWKSESEVFEMAEISKEELEQLVKSLVEESKADGEEPVKVEPQTHPLDAVLAELKGTYDKAIAEKYDPATTLKAMQQPLEGIGRAVLADVQKVQPTPNTDVEVINALTELSKAVALINQQLAGQARVQSGAPVRRSIPATVFADNTLTVPTSETPKLQQLVRKSMGLQ